MARPKMVIPGTVFNAQPIDVASIAAVTVIEVTATVKGARLNFPVIVFAPSLEANLLIGGAYCSAKDTIKFRIVNPTAGAIDPASQTFYFVQF